VIWCLIIVDTDSGNYPGASMQRCFMSVNGDRYKCGHCYLFISSEDVVFEGEKKVPRCPLCQNVVEKACPNDHPCHCLNSITGGIHYCAICGAPTCPCGSEDVEIVSRVTGYLQALKGWNSAKKQELKDRRRYDVAVN
jgi:hypothetical protein